MRYRAIPINSEGQARCDQDGAYGETQRESKANASTGPCVGEKVHECKEYTDTEKVREVKCPEEGPNTQPPSHSSRSCQHCEIEKSGHAGMYGESEAFSKDFSEAVVKKSCGDHAQQSPNGDGSQPHAGQGIDPPKD